MAEKPTYEELEQRIRVLEQRNLEYSRTERLFQDSEESFKKLADYAPVQISLIALDDDTRYLYVNREWETVIGYTKAGKRRKIPPSFQYGGECHVFGRQHHHPNPGV